MKIIRKFKSLNLFIIIILGLLAFALLYFLYHRQRSQAWVYVSVSLVRPQNISLNIAYNSVPYWVGNSIAIGDTEQNLLGSVGAIVEDKESFDWFTFGQTVNLVLKVNASRDRTGVYLYKNKPLLVGSILDLKLSNTQTQGIITNIGEQKPTTGKSQLVIEIKGKQIDPYIADSLVTGDEIKNNKNETIAKVIDKKSTPAQVRTDTAAGVSLVSLDNTKRDLTVTIQMKADKFNDVYYFASTQKIKVNEVIYLPFKSVALNYPITSVSQPKETDSP